MVGLPGRGGCLVAELQHAAGSASAVLITFRSDDDDRRWTEKELLMPKAALVGNAGGWGGDGVFTHDGAMCWVDLRCGILCCDPLAEQPALVFHGLPAGSSTIVDTSDTAAGEAVRATRCVNASNGHLTFAEVHRDGVGGAAALALWTRDDGSWRMGPRLALSELWATTDIDDQIVPDVVLDDPRVPGVVYLFLEGHILVVDVPSNRLLEIEKSPCTSSTSFSGSCRRSHRLIATHAILV
ncbi:hypothetical protein SEVIR_6G080101v4 [Setaria viridis]